MHAGRREHISVAQQGQASTPQVMGLDFSLKHYLLPRTLFAFCMVVGLLPPHSQQGCAEEETVVGTIYFSLLPTSLKHIYKAEKLRLWPGRQNQRGGDLHGEALGSRHSLHNGAACLQLYCCPASLWLHAYMLHACLPCFGDRHCSVRQAFPRFSLPLGKLPASDILCNPNHTKSTRGGARLPPTSARTFSCHIHTLPGRRVSGLKHVLVGRRQSMEGEASMSRKVMCVCGGEGGHTIQQNQALLALW